MGSTGSGNIGSLGTAHEDVNLFYFLSALPMIYTFTCIVTKRLRNKRLYLIMTTKTMIKQMKCMSAGTWLQVNNLKRYYPKLPKEPMYQRGSNFQVK